MKYPFILICITVLLIGINYPKIKRTVQFSIANYYYPTNSQYQEVVWSHIDKRVDLKKEFPNIILIIADDLGINDLSDRKTPHINSIYHNGVRFTKSYATQATCAPSRASLFSGRFPTKLGLEFTPHPFSLDVMMAMQRGLVHDHLLNYSNSFSIPAMEYLSLDKDEKLISNILHKYNYTNYFVGKWHLGETDGFRPLERGYDESLSFLQGASMYHDFEHQDIIGHRINDSVYDNYMNTLLPFGISHNNKPFFRPNRYMTDYLSDQTVSIIEHINDNPFFITLAYNAPHNPYQSLRKDYDLQEGTHKEKVYRGMINAIDRGVGKIIDSLKENNKYDNTLVIFTSDNGGTNLVGIDDINHPFSGWKCTFFEGGIRVPMYWQWPNKIPSGIVYDKTVSHVDLFATIQSIVGHKEPNRDGVDLIPYLLNNDRKYVKVDPHPVLFWRSADYRLLKFNEWKFSISEKTGKSWLFNLNDDIQEKNNLLSLVNFNETVRKRYTMMHNLINKINDQQKDPLWKSPIMTAIPIYSPHLESFDDEYVYCCL